MKEVKHYICEICGTEYNDKTKAQGCEKGRKKPVEITKVNYVSAFTQRNIGNNPR